jgi:hypothetical protein
MEHIHLIGERFRRLNYRPAANPGEKWEAQARGRKIVTESGRTATENDTHAFGNTCEEALENLVIKLSQEN